MTERRARRPSRPWRVALPWFLAALVVATAGLPSAVAATRLPAAPMIGFAHALSGNSTVAVNLTDRPSFAPNSLVANASATLSVHLENAGAYPHTFTLSKVPNMLLNTSWTPTELYAFFNANGSLANVSVAPGASAWANVSFNASVGGDSFEFVSVVPYQFQAGMSGTLQIASTGPPLALFDNTTDSYAFVPAVLSASPTHFPAKLSVLVTNTGSLDHTFTVSPFSNYTLSPANFSQFFSTNAPLVSVPVGSGAGTTVYANLTVRGPGVYQYICEIDDHFANGMTGDLYVGITPPPIPAAPSTAVVETWVLLGSAVLLGIGVVIAIVASYSGRFPSKPGGSEKHP